MTNYISVLEGLLFVAGDDWIILEEASYTFRTRKKCGSSVARDELKKRLEEWRK